MIKYYKVLSSLCLLLTFNALAQTSSVSTISNSSKKDSEFKFSSKLNLGASSNLQNRNSNSHEEYRNLELIPSLNYGSNTLRTYGEVSKEEFGNRETKVSDSYVSYIYNFGTFNEFATITSQIRGNIPLSDASKIRDSKIFGLGIGPGFVFDLSKIKFHGLTFTYSPMLTRNFYRYTTNTLGRVNNEYALSNLLNLSYALGNFYLSTTYVNRSAWTFRGNKKDDSFLLSEELGYSFNKNFTFALGHSNEASVLQSNKVDSNIRAYDQNTSSIYSSLYISF